MPYSNQWVDPAVYLEHEGVKIYCTYKNGLLESGPNTYHFTTCDNDMDEDYHFDVRDIRRSHITDTETDAWPDITVRLYKTMQEKAKANGGGRNKTDIIREILCAAIEQGSIKQDEPFPA